MSMSKMLTACAVMASLAACASSGNGRIDTLTQDRAAVMLKGKSKSQVRNELGEPAVTEFPSGQAIWVYQVTDGAAKFVKYVPLIGRMSATGTKIKELKILFGKDGLVKKYQLQDIQSQ